MVEHMVFEVKTLAANIETVPMMMDFIEGLTEGLPNRAAFDLTLACEEILVNIANYAYPNGKGEYTVRWENDMEKRIVTMIFEDSGVPFNPLQKEDPDLSVPFKERKIGGLGIMMVRQRMDQVQYSYTNEQNILTIEKRY
jgi:anti-sigma regulatory factor (Ser/Thr protein kinase)